VTSCGIKILLDYKASFENSHPRANLEICTQSYEMKLKLVCFQTFPLNLVYINIMTFQNVDLHMYRRIQYYAKTLQVLGFVLWPF